MGKKTKEYRVFGPPGTGKTTYLTQQIQAAAEKHGIENILVASFTKTAAQELAGRNIEAEGSIGTLHSHCYRAIGFGEIAETKISDFNKEFPHFRLSAESGAVSVEDNAFETGPIQKTMGDELFHRMNVLRARMIPMDLWPQNVKIFRAAWQTFKRVGKLIDFTDMIEIAYYDLDTAPGLPKIGFFDEAQDFTPLELALVRKWGKEMDYIVICGDDDQCQPAGTMIDTVRGKVDIKDLVDGDKVWAYARGDACIYTKGYEIKKACRMYSGPMYTVKAAGRQTRATDNHKWFAKWDYSRTAGKYCVYLMSKFINGHECFRVGWCKVFRSDRCFHLGQRARLEKADKAWILTITNSKSEASIIESYVSAKYNIPTIMFTPHSPDETDIYNSGNLDKFWKMIAENKVDIDKTVFSDYGRKYEYPFWKPNTFSKYGTPINIYPTCNLIPEMMLLPIADYNNLRKIPWVPFTLSKEYVINEPVYSLDVEKYESYIADGIITHNCIYSWLGASTDVFLEGEPDIKKVLSQSFRVPRAVHAYAEKWVSQIRHREPKEYKPRDFEGEVRFLEDGSYNNPDAIIKDAEKYIEQGKTIMFLASCSYMLAGIIERLKKQGILFHNPYRLKQGQWNPIRLNAGEGKISTVQRLLAYLAGCPEIAPEPRLWTLDEFKQWVAIVNSKGNLRHGAKKLLEGKAGGVFEVNYRDLIEAFDEESSFWKALDDFGLDTALNWFQNNVQAAKVKTLEFPIAIIRKQRTYDCLSQKPKCIVGTIHSVKGGEADCVYLMPDLSVAGMQEYIKGGEGRDAVNRMFYVGITRARESLILCGPGTNFSVRWDI